MITVRRRRLAAASLAVVATLGLSACGTGFDAQTNKVYQPAVGANHRGEVDVLNTLLVANADGSATLSAGVVNNADTEDQLDTVAVTTLAGKPLTVSALDKKVALQSGVLTTLGGASDAGGHVVAKGATPGAYVKVTLSFTDAGPVTIEAPVVARTAMYDDVSGGDGLTPAEVSGDRDD